MSEPLPIEYIEQVLRLARQHGVRELQAGDLRFALGPDAPGVPGSVAQAALCQPLTDQQLLMWSAGAPDPHDAGPEVA